MDLIEKVISMSKVTQSEVILVVERVLKLKLGQLKENTHANEIENWDSVGQLEILVTLDKLFDGKIASINEMAEADSMTKILNILRQKSLV